MMPMGYAIYLAKDNKSLRLVEFPIQQYSRSQQLMRYLNERKDDTITGADLKAAGFEEITEELMYPTRPMGQSGCGPLADDTQITLNDSGYRQSSLTNLR